MNSILDPSWGNWEDTTSGSGTTNVDANYNLVTTAGVGDVAYKRKKMVVTAGDVVEIKVEARLTSSATPTAGIYIDYPSTGNLLTSVEIDSQQWKSYTLKFTIPMDHSQVTDTLQVVCGAITTDDSAAEFRNPRMKVLNSMAARVWACGLVNIDSSGVCTLVPSGPSANLLSYSYSAPDLTVTVPRVVNVTGNDPTPTARVTTTSPAAYGCKADYEVSGTGTFVVKLLDMSTGVYLAGNPSADTTLYIEVKY
tara:strand:+ start:783 stop:1538 length:756 start_codon:yes stop_codon:yes gene_type:complete